MGVSNQKREQGGTKREGKRGEANRVRDPCVFRRNIGVFSNELSKGTTWKSFPNPQSSISNQISQDLTLNLGKTATKGAHGLGYSPPLFEAISSN